MKGIIVGCGYVGSRIAAIWQEKGIEVNATTRSPEKISDLFFWIEEGKPLKIDADFCLFSVSTNHLEAASSLILSADTHLIYTGTTSVYADGDVVTEESPLKDTPLTQTEKVLLEHPKTTILRLGQITGPGRSLVPRRKVLPGTGENPVNISPIDDIVRGIEFVRENQLLGIYNLVSDLHITRKELYESLGVKDIVWDPHLTSLHGGKKVVSNEKLKKQGFNL